jgi:hypothetical protein
MSIKRIMKKRFCLGFGAALAVAGVLAAERSGPPPGLENGGYVYVYFPSLCAAPGDSSDCREIPQPERPSFDSMAACSAHADVALRNVHNPRIMASCMREREV